MNRTDNFNRANDSTALGTPSDGGSAWAFDGSGGKAWGINSNAAYDVYDTGGQYAAYLESSATDTVVQATFTVAGDAQGLCGRLSDASNYIYVLCDSFNGARLLKIVAGSPTVLATYSFTPTNGDVLALVLSADQVSVKINGVTRIGPVTETFNQTATKHGLSAFSAYVTTARWDDFSITDTAALLTAGVVSLVSSGPASIKMIATDASGGTAPYTYQWQRNTDGGSYSNLSNGSGVSGATALSLTDGSATTGHLYGYKIVYTDSAGTPAVVTSSAVTASVYSGGPLIGSGSVKSGQIRRKR